MSKVEIPDKVHKEVKKFALEHDLSLKDAYAGLVEFALEHKHDRTAVKKIKRDKGSGDDEIIVGS